ncbi:MAG: FtsX-like permease family protein [Gammaproteobacteria bacterium]|nr:MAG: FtsX-like permease family protein [Gammaproteobacteria bacterium]
MNIKIFLLALKSLRFRKLSIGLTIFSLAISVVLLLGVDIIRVQAKEKFANTISGTDLIVGSRSGSTQLLLYSIFHLGNATNNVSWESYNKIISHPRVNWSIPISLGDSHKGYRVVGTTTDIFQYYRYSKRHKLTFSSGQEFSGIFGAVLGAEVAKKLDYQLDEKIILAHGMGNVSFAEHKNLPFTVTGILKPTGTPIDRSVLITLKGLEAVHIGWEQGVPSKNAIQTNDLEKDDDRLQSKSITAFLLGLKNKQDIFSIQRGINNYKSEPLLAILPGIALMELWKVVGAVEKVMLIIAALVVVTGLLGMLAIILTNLNERRREIAVLRSVGASPKTIFTLMVIESEILVILGIFLGLIILYFLLALINPMLFNTYGLNIELQSPTKLQWIMLLIILLGGLVAAIFPAISAYRKTLQDGLTIRT